MGSSMPEKKYIAIQHHFVREAQANSEFNTQYTPTEQLIAEELTKARPQYAFWGLRSLVGLETR